MLARVLSAAILGIDSFLVEVEVDVTSGLPCFQVVGLPQGAVREGRDRVLTSLAHVGHPIPPRRIVVNLAPADVPKEGSAFDLPLALGLLVGAGLLSAEAVRDTLFVGELGLDGSVRPIRGALSVALACRAAGLGRLVVPEANAPEAAAVSSIRVYGFGHLGRLVGHLRGTHLVQPSCARARAGQPEQGRVDIADVRGQERAKRALQIAAAGGHNLLLEGPPGAGKTLLARSLPGLLPALREREAIETTRIHSVAGLLPPGGSLIWSSPFRAPHHSISDAGLVGGGRPPRPGEVSLAHHGVLFLDELPEFRRSALETLRQPMEEGEVLIGRVRASVRFPTRFQLVAAMNPCPCGLKGVDGMPCPCSEEAVRRYRGRLSGPLLDRIDLFVWVPRVRIQELDRASSSPGDVLAYRSRIAAARERQRARIGPDGRAPNNAAMTMRDLERVVHLGTGARTLVQKAAERLLLSARAYHRLLRVARTVADLEDAEAISEQHVGEALQYRRDG